MSLYLNSIKLFTTYIYHEQRIGTHRRIHHLSRPWRRRHHRILCLRGNEEPATGSFSQSPVVIPLSRVAIVSCIIGTISMWIMWACTYMHQMNPIIEPILMAKK